MGKRESARFFIVLSLIVVFIVAFSVFVLAANAQCGSSLNTCSSGSVEDSADNSTHYLWKCIATNGTGTNTSCSSLKHSNTNTNTNTNTGDDKIDDAYACLEANVNKSLSVQEIIFSILALGDKKGLFNKLENEKKTNENCWPKSGCKIRDTAQALMAYERLGKNTDAIESWLISKNASMNDLNWFLEIDISNRVSAECAIRYSNTEKIITIGEDMKIQGDTGSCLAIIGSGYWMQIRDNCFDRKFEISCNQDFITTLLYTKKSGDTLYISSNTHSSASLGTTSEEINARCFKTGAACDYEGSLWATLALQKQNYNIDVFKPYLIALADENTKYFPSAFIYKITGGDDQYNNIVQSQKRNQYWEMTASPYRRFYDTSLGMLALKGSSAPEYDNAKQYLLGIQGKDGCWDNTNVLSTAFVLYSGWPKSVGGGGTPSGPVLCESANFYCEPRFQCQGAGGQTLDNYYCTGLGEVCCSQRAQQQSCTQKQGTICGNNEECDGTSVSSSDPKCCLGECKEIEQQDTCEGICQSGTSCDDNQELGEGICVSSEKICCVEKTGGGGISWIWIVLLIILIVLVVLAIIFRDKLRVWWFKFRGKASSTPVTKPSGPPGPPRMQFRPRPIGPFGPRQLPPAQRTIQKPVQTRPMSEKDKEMEETLKKLREMSK